MEFLAALAILGTVFAMFYGVDYMAKRRGRSRVGYFLFALLFNPLIAAIVLLMVGTAWDYDGAYHND